MKVGTLGKCTLSSKSSQASVRLPPIYSKTKVDTDEKEKIEAWANRFQNLLNIPSANGIPLVPTAGPLSCVSSDPHHTTKSYLLSTSSRTTKREVLTTFPRLFHRGAPSVCQPLQELFALIWLHQKIPDDWNIAIIIPCYKK